MRGAQVTHDTLTLIFGTILGWHLGSGGFSAEVRALAGGLIGATLAVYGAAAAHLRPTPARCHYTFNLRDFARVVQVRAPSSWAAELKDTGPCRRPVSDLTLWAQSSRICTLSSACVHTDTKSCACGDVGLLLPIYCMACLHQACNGRWKVLCVRACDWQGAYMQQT